MQPAPVDLSTATPTMPPKIILPQVIPFDLSCTVPAFGSAGTYPSFLHAIVSGSQACLTVTVPGVDGI